MTEENTQQEQAQESPQQEEVKEKKEGGNAIAVLSYLGILVIIPILVDKENDFVKFHIKQGLTLLVTGIIGMFVGVVPIIGWIIAPFITLALIVLAILGIVNVLGGKKKELPLIGKYAEKFNI